MKQFFHTVKASFGASSLYKQATVESGWKGIKFLVKFSLFLGLILGVVGIILSLIFVPQLTRKLSTFANNSYPDDLVLTFANKTLTTNRAEPVVVPLPPQFREADTKELNLVVVAPTEPADPSVLEKYQAFAVLTSKGLVAGSARDQIRIQPYTSNAVVTKALFMSRAATILRMIRIAAVVGSIPLAIFFVLMIAGMHLLWLVIVALIIFLQLKIRKLSFSYKQAYKMGIYAIVPLMLIEIIATPLDMAGKLLSALVLVGITWIASRHWVFEHTPTEIVVQPPEIEPGA
ncbi:MAG TPA: DUF1189 family protein [Candidatus Paceibacterota bacterium]|nr:DUF1189 family protein [Candidatus Paceibacterota bacterium]